MKIRDIRHFRTYYKKAVRQTNDANRDEHFIGQQYTPAGSKEDVFGFFDIYHGDKARSEGIIGFLRGFLDMAKDSQAIYEFLQNAVDADSTRFEMHLNEEYFLAVNNGKQFDFEGIRSILNVGVSTKSTDSSNIGKFGIGFKLIHRLVGENSGIEELTEKLYGPILFSWGEHQQLIDLAQFANSQKKFEFAEGEYSRIEGEAGKYQAMDSLPWLFKILLTNFPCQPNEQVRDLNYCLSEQTLFSTQDVDRMGQWITEKLPYQTADFAQGSLFFLRLGKDKHQYVATENLHQGIQFSLSILNEVAKANDKKGLEQVIINQNHFVPAPIEFERFLIPFDSADYWEIDPQRRGENDQSPIEILFGFTTYQEAQELIKGAPNFYLFFPLSEEVHNLLFVVHSTAFYNGSQRTNLHNSESTDSKGVNERLFRKFVALLTNRLDELTREDESRFLTIYSCILGSSKATEKHRMWIDKPLYEPLLAYIARRIPTRRQDDAVYSYATDGEQVRIKNTKLAICPADFGVDAFEWFYWSDEDNSDLVSEAYDADKLDLNRANLVDLISESIDLNLVEDWLQQASEKDYEDFLDELNRNWSKANEKLNKLRFIKFGDTFYSPQEIIADTDLDLLLINDRLEPIKHLLEEVGFTISDINLQQFKAIYDTYYNTRIKYLTPSQIIDRLNTKCGTNTLAPPQKKLFYDTIWKYVRDENKEKIPTLKLFSDSEGVKPLNQLLKRTYQKVLPTFLTQFQLLEAEYFEDLDGQLVTEELLYSAIILPKWAELCASITEDEVVNLYKDTIHYFGLKSDNAHINASAVYLNDEQRFVAGGYFYHEDLKSLSRTNYQLLDLAVAKLSNYECILPFQPIVSQLSEPPFALSNDGFFDEVEISEAVLDIREITVLFSLLKNIGELPLDYLSFKEGPTPTSIIVCPVDSDKRQYYDKRLEVVKFLTNNFPQEFIKLPTSLKDYRKDHGPILQDSDLLHEVLALVEDEMIIELLPILKTIQNGEVIQSFLANHINKLILDSTISYDQEDREYQILELATVYLKDEQEREAFTEKLFLRESNEVYPLSGLTTNDDIENSTYRLSQLFPEEYDKAGLVKSTIERFNGLQAGLRKLLGLERRKEAREVLNEFFGLESLQNAHQLAFVVEYLQREPDTDIEGLCAKTKSEETYALEDTYYTHDLPIIRDVAILHECYTDLDKLIFKKKQNVLSLTDEFKITQSPWLDGNTFNCPYLKENLSEEETISFLDSLRVLLANTKEKEISWDTVEWAKHLGWTPNQKIFTKDPELWLLKKERLPDYILSWFSKYDAEEMNLFCHQLGIRLESDLIIRIRKCFSDQEELTVEDIQLDEVSSLNTLRWLKREKIKIKSKFTKLLKQLYESIDELNPVFLPKVSNENYTLSWQIIDIDQLSSYDITDTLKETLESYSQEYDSFLSHCLTNDFLLTDLTFLPENLYAELNTKILEDEIIWDDLNISLLQKTAKSLTDNPPIELWEQRTNWTVKTISGQIPYSLTLEDNVLGTYTAGEYIAIKSDRCIYINKTSLHNFKQIIKELFGENVINEREFKDFDEELSEGKKDLSHELSKRAKEQTLKSEVYSFEWFRALINWERNERRKTLYQKKLKFREIELISNDLLKFSNPDVETLPDSLEEYFEDGIVNVTIGKVRNRLTIRAQIVRQTDFDLYLTVLDESQRRSLYAQDLSGNVGVLEIPAKDLLMDTLFERIDSSLATIETEWSITDYIAESFDNEDISLLFGPPGTGKTTTLALQILSTLEQAQRSHKAIRILMITPTNKASNVIMEKMAAFMDMPTTLDQYVSPLFTKEESVRVRQFLTVAYPKASANYRFIRLGVQSSESLQQKGWYENPEVINQQETIILATTMHRYPYARIGGEPIVHMDWDYVILDEASMIPLPYALLPLFQSATTTRFVATTGLTSRFVFAGDPFQILPVGLTPGLGDRIEAAKSGQELKGWNTENIYTLLGLTSFQQDETEVGPFAISKLMTQYRSCPDIGQLVSMYQYEGLVHSQKTENIAYEWGQDKTNPVTFIDFPIEKESENAYQLFRHEDKFGYHIYSAILACELAMALAHQNNEMSIGIMAPYSIQVRMLYNLIEVFKKADDRLKNIEVSTVHRFQGDEKDAVIFVNNPPRLKVGDIAHYNNSHIINVAISRAKSHLFVLKPDPNQMTVSGHYQNKIEELTSLAEDPSEIDAANFEKMVMDNYQKPLVELIGLEEFTNFLAFDVASLQKKGLKYECYVSSENVNFLVDTNYNTVAVNELD
jgi:superfamily I DNA and/or RNA helicase